MRFIYDFNLMMESLGKSIKIDYSDPISRRRENIARRRLRACCRRVSVAGCSLTFSPVPLRLQRNLRDGSVGFFMYFHLVCSPDVFRGRVWEKRDAQAFPSTTKLMVLIDHGFVENSTSPPFAFVSCPSDMGTSLPLGKRLIGLFWDTHGCEKGKSKLCANANLVYL